MSLPTGNWNYPTSVRFGCGRIAELPGACRDLGMTRPLLVTDPDLAALPMVAEAVARCADAGLPAAVFSGIKGNPTGANVDAVTEWGRSHKKGLLGKATDSRNLRRQASKTDADLEA